MSIKSFVVSAAVFGLLLSCYSAGLADTCKFNCHNVDTNEYYMPLADGECGHHADGTELIKIIAGRQNVGTETNRGHAVWRNDDDQPSTLE